MNIEHREVVEKESKLQEHLVLTERWRCCLNCIHWNGKQELCELFKARPPARIIVVACVDHEFDIPF